MKRIFFGQIGKLRKEKVAEYKKLHAYPWPEVLKTIHECNLVNYSIFCHGDVVFAYFEYVGGDYDADMKKMERDAATQEWWKHTRPCFEPYAFSERSEFYHDMGQIFYYA